jgi:two-component system, cell cycle sensor histidine kinase and response regulator CckA
VTRPDQHPNEGATVLVVDDEPDVRRVTSLMLQRSGYETIEASDGREAVEAVAAKGEVIGAVLLDVVMPEMSGPDALVEMRRLDVTLPVVFISGYSRNEVATYLAEATAYTSFLPKPFTRDDLLAEIAQAMGSRPVRG